MLKLNVIELDAVGRQFEPYFTTGCVCVAVPLWCGLGCRSLHSRGLIKLQRSQHLILQRLLLAELWSHPWRYMLRALLVHVSLKIFTGLIEEDVAEPAAEEMSDENKEEDGVEHAGNDA